MVAEAAAAVRAAKEKVLAVMAVDGKVAVEGKVTGERVAAVKAAAVKAGVAAAKAATGKKVEERAVVAAAAMVEVGKVWRSGG